MRHHQEADSIQAQLGGFGDVLLGNVGFGTVRGHADTRHAQFFGHQEVVNGADTGQQQGRNFGLLHFGNHCAEIFFVAVGGKTVVEGRAAQSVAVGHFDQRHTSFIEASGDVYHFV